MTFEEAIASLTEKFTSGNPIEVERTVITREEFLAIVNKIADMEDEMFLEDEVSLDALPYTGDIETINLEDEASNVGC